MNCRSIEAKLSAFIDQELGGQDMLIIKQHLNACPKCQKEFDSLKVLKGALRGLKTQSPNPEFETRLFVAISKEANRSQLLDVRRPVIWKSMVSAAVLTAAIVVVGLRIMPKQLVEGTTTVSPSISSDQAALAASDPLGNPNSAILISSGQ